MGIGSRFGRLGLKLFLKIINLSIPVKCKYIKCLCCYYSYYVIITYKYIIIIVAINYKWWMWL